MALLWFDCCIAIPSCESFVSSPIRSRSIEVYRGLSRPIEAYRGLSRPIEGYRGLQRAIQGLPSTQWHQAAPNGTKQHPMAPRSPDSVTSYPHALIYPVIYQVISSRKPSNLLGNHPMLIIRIILNEDQVNVSRGTYPAQYAYNQNNSKGGPTHAEGKLASLRQLLCTWEVVLGGLVLGVFSFGKGYFQGFLSNICNITLQSLKNML